MRKLFLFLTVIFILFNTTGCSSVRKANEHEYDMISAADSEHVLPPAEDGGSGQALPDPAVSDYDRFLADDGQEPLTIESYIQQRCVWEDGRTSLYLGDETGAYYVYRLACSAAEYESMQPGQKIRVTGYKTEFSGEPQITDAAFALLEGEYLTEPSDISSLPEEDLYRYVNHSVSLRGFRVDPMFDGKSAFFYGWDHSGSADEGSDLFFTVKGDGFSCSSVVKTCLIAPGTDVYFTVENLHVGDVVDLTGILTWYNGPQLLVTEVTVHP